MSVNRDSPIPQCVACIEGKHSVTPFGHSQSRASVPGEVTHIDLWGKYDITSIHGNSYYMLAVDDVSRYVTIYFLKTKAAASERVQNYLAYVSVRHPAPRSIKVDRRSEFLNDALRTWCATHGIEIHVTAPYSPAQNGVAERFNRMLVELARTMLTDVKLPEFLWEPAVAHAAYIRNRAYTKAVNGMTPYERWTEKRPNVSPTRIWRPRLDPKPRSKRDTKNVTEIAPTEIRGLRRCISIRAVLQSRDEKNLIIP
jgi:hypothetical protein